MRHAENVVNFIWIIKKTSTKWKKIHISLDFYRWRRSAVGEKYPRWTKVFIFDKKEIRIMKILMKWFLYLCILPLIYVFMFNVHSFHTYIGYSEWQNSSWSEKCKNLVCTILKSKYLHTYFKNLLLIIAIYTSWQNFTLILSFLLLYNLVFVKKYSRVVIVALIVMEFYWKFCIYLPFCW